MLVDVDVQLAPPLFSEPVAGPAGWWANGQLNHVLKRFTYAFQ